MVQEINVLFEVGAITTLRQKPVNAVTHDWTLFVRGYRGLDISVIVEKVVFHLHETFPKPVRVLKHPPYEVTECGYGSFETTIEVHFRNKSEPRKAEITFDLWLATGSFDPVTTQRSERMRFYDVTDEFATKLFKAGGFIPNTSQDPFWSKSLTQDSKPSPHATSVKPETTHSHKKSAPNALVASKPSSTAAVASRSESSAVGAGRSGKPSSLALTSAGAASKPVCDIQPPAAKCVTPQTPDSFADLFSHPHLTVKNKEKKKSGTATGNSYSNCSSNSTPKELCGDQGDKDSAKQKRLLEESLFGEDDSPQVKKIKPEKEKHHKDVTKVKESKDDKSDKSRDSREEKSEKSKYSKHSRPEKNRDKHEKKKEGREDKHEKNRDHRDDKSVNKSEHAKHKKRDEENKTKHASVDSSSRSSSSKTPEVSVVSRHGEISKPVSTSGLSSDQPHTKRHSSSDGKHHSKSHKEHHRSVNSSSKPVGNIESDGGKVKIKTVVRSDVEEKVDTRAKSTTSASQINTQDSLDFSETSDNEGTISESLTILAKSSSGRLNIDHLFGSDDSMDSLNCKPFNKKVVKITVEGSSPGKNSISNKGSCVDSKDNPKVSQSEHRKKSKVKVSDKSAVIKSDGKDKSSKSSSNSNELKLESIKLERKSGIGFTGALLGTFDKQPASRSPVKVKSETLIAEPVKEVVPKQKDIEVEPCDLVVSSSEESDSDASDESVDVDDVMFGVHDEQPVVSNYEDPSSVDLNTTKAPNGEVLSALLDLQLKLMTNLNDDQLEHLTCLIEETGKYKVSNDTFDFDLCVLDAHTVQKIRQFVEQSA